MSEKGTDNLVTVNIDGQELRVPKGTNMIEAAASLKKEVPHYCYHPKLSVSGNCRMCLVEMGMPMRDRATGEAILDDDGNQKIGWMPKPAIACATEAAEGMHIKTESELTKSCQEGVMEMLLVNHPLDCPICDQAGECTLQEFATEYGKGYSRFVENKNVKPKRTRLGPRVTLDDERCILCSRCIRFMKEVADDDVLGFTERGSYSTLTCYPGKELNHNYSLNTVDICPVGALTSTDFRFKMRVWFLKKVRSICTESSVGVNTYVWSREGKIHRITPRQNDAVNDTWMADSGRDLYKAVEAENRLTKARCSGNQVSLSEAQIRAAEVVKSGKTAFVGSSYMSLEEQYLFKELAKESGAEVFWASHTGKNDGLLISEDRTPNMRGALVTGLLNELPSDDLSALSKRLEAGEFDNLVVVREDITGLGISEAQLSKVNLVYFGTHENATSEQAFLQIPLLTVFEKAGSFVNEQFRLQTFEQAVPGPAGVLPDINTFNNIVSELRVEGDRTCNIHLIWEHIQRDISELEGIKYSSIPEEGLLLKKDKWAGLNFCEGESLHYNPLMEAAKA